MPPPALTYDDAIRSRYLLDARSPSRVRLNLSAEPPLVAAAHLKCTIVVPALDMIHAPVASHRSFDRTFRIRGSGTRAARLFLCIDRHTETPANFCFAIAPPPIPWRME
jgi:hypothetical protein